jgi:hypothetical protein
MEELMHHDSIKTVRKSLHAFAKRQGSGVAARCRIIAQNLVLLERKPDNVGLRVQTMRNVEDLKATLIAARCQSVSANSGAGGGE